MRAMMGREESVFGFVSGALVEEEGARSGGERSEPERMAPLKAVHRCRNGYRDRSS